MNIEKENIKDFLDKKIRIVTSSGFTYVGYILSHGEDYIKIRDKYEQIRFISFKFIDLFEAAEWNTGIVQSVIR